MSNSKDMVPNINTMDICNIISDSDIGAFLCFVARGKDDLLVEPIESDGDGDVIKVWYSNNQVLELKVKWTIMEDQEER